MPEENGTQVTTDTTATTTEPTTTTEPATPAATTDAEPKPAEGTEPKAADDKGAEPKAAEELTLESYGTLDSIQAPEGVKIDAAAVSSLKQLALENKISPEVASKLVQVQLESAKRQVEDFAALQKTWEEQNAQTYGENLKNVETNCSRVLAELDKSGKFKELLALAGAEKHPATLEFLKNIGDNLLEKASVNPNETAGKTKELSLEDFN